MTVSQLGTNGYEDEYTKVVGNNVLKQYDLTLLSLLEGDMTEVTNRWYS